MASWQWLACSLTGRYIVAGMCKNANSILYDTEHEGYDRGWVIANRALAASPVFSLDETRLATLTSYKDYSTYTYKIAITSVQSRTILHTLRIDTVQEIGRIDFGLDGTFLQTNVGDIELEQEQLVLNDYFPARPSRLFSPITVSNGGDWIRWRGHAAIWIWPQYRIQSSVVRGYFIMCSCDNGRNLVFRFKPNEGQLYI